MLSILVGTITISSLPRANSKKRLLIGKILPLGIFLKKKEKRKILDRLSSLQASKNYHTSTFLKNLEDDLQKDYNGILKIEEDY